MPRSADWYNTCRWTSRCTFAANCPMPRCMKRCKAHSLVLCSDVETFGIVLIEAIACGLPVIATKCGGPEDVITDEIGLLVERNDPGALGTAMRQMHDTAVRYSPAALHEYADRHFGEHAVSAQVFDVYRDILHARVQC